MANNRMYLINRRTGDKLYLAKYYPSTGWYTVQTDLENVLNETFYRADFGADSRPVLPRFLGTSNAVSGGGMYGDEWELEYETRSDPSGD